jgi:hypothetical protein
MSTNFHCTKLNLSKCNSLWVVPIKQNTNFNFQLSSTFVLLCFTKMVLLKILYPLKSYQYAKSDGPVLTCASSATPSEVWTSLILEWLKLQE